MLIEIILGAVVGLTVAHLCLRSVFQCLRDDGVACPHQKEIRLFFMMVCAVAVGIFGAIFSAIGTGMPQESMLATLLDAALMDVVFGFFVVIFTFIMFFFGR